MKLELVIKELSEPVIQGDIEAEITGICFDSREVSDGNLFVAVRGTQADGHRFIPLAAEAGATAIICEEFPADLPSGVTMIKVKNSRKALAAISSSWYNHPSRELNLIGVTGTNGKTTIATLLYKVNTGLGYKAGILTTIGVFINGRTFKATHTTPDPLQINRWLRKMVDEGCTYCFMEVSSHAAAQNRVDHLDFNGGLFTNITHDHLDYHKDFKEYLSAKSAFFNLLPKTAFALTNVDDKNGKVVVQSSKATIHTYGLSRLAEFHGRLLEENFDGMSMLIDGQEVWLRLAGRFNAYNVLCVFGACILLGHDREEVLQQLSAATSAEGRFNVIRGKEERIGIVDYAHTPDAVKNVLETIREICREEREVITVIGAGGDRDKTKRPQMAKVALDLSNRLVLTSDNPRSEIPGQILEDMEKGIPAERLGDTVKIENREEAIKTACLIASKRAVILVAGKGHEKYQEIGGEKLPFDDKAVLTKYIT